MLLTNKTFQKYNGRTGVIIGLTWCIATFIFICYLSNINRDFLLFGPNDKILFIKIKVDTWGKWSGLMVYSAFSQIVSSVMSSTVKPFITNVIRDHKTPWDLHYYYQSQSIVLLYYTYGWITGILDMFVYLTCQIQFWIPAFLADVIVQMYFTHYHLTCKELPRLRETTELL